MYILCMPIFVEPCVKSRTIFLWNIWSWVRLCKDHILVRILGHTVHRHMSWGAWSAGNVITRNVGRYRTGIATHRQRCEVTAHSQSADTHDFIVLRRHSLSSLLGKRRMASALPSRPLFIRFLTVWTSPWLIMKPSHPFHNVLSHYETPGNKS